MTKPVTKLTKTNQHPSYRKNNNSETTPPKEKPTAKSNKPTNTIEQPSHQKSHTQTNKTHTHPISKLRVDGEFKGCTKDRTVRDTLVSELL